MGKRCPNCGACTECGHGGYRPYPYPPPIYPRPWPARPYWGTLGGPSGGQWSAIGTRWAAIGAEMIGASTRKPGEEVAH